MAWVFELAIECGRDRDTAIALKSHFDGFPFTPKSGTTGRCVVQAQGVTTDEDNNWWISVLPVFPGSNVVQHSESPDVLREIAFALYGRLRSAPRYRFALVGTETSQFNTFANLKRVVSHPGLQGLVLREEIYVSLERPIGFEPFAPGYVWRPYA